MIKRTIQISSPSLVTTENEQVVIKNRETGSIASIPIEDIGTLIIESLQITITTTVISKLLSMNSAIVFCDYYHLPIGVCLPMQGNFAQTERLAKQIELKLPTKKNLWAQLVKAKIRNQSLVLDKYNLDSLTLRKKIEKIKSGDSSNQEGSASAYYWKTLFPSKDFKRERYGIYPNNLLNYGYSILRAIVARELVSVGLHPSIGLFHKNKYNPFCLADDIMEPFRPVVDDIVYKYYLVHPEYEELNKSTKQELLMVSYSIVKVNNKKQQISFAIQNTCSSLVNCIMNKSKKLVLPELWN
jgi:CRISPR-associated protein Cas1